MYVYSNPYWMYNIHPAKTRMGVHAFKQALRERPISPASRITPRADGLLNFSDDVGPSGRHHRGLPCRSIPKAPTPGFARYLVGRGSATCRKAAVSCYEFHCSDDAGVNLTNESCCLSTHGFGWQTNHVLCFRHYLRNFLFCYQRVVAPPP